MKRLTLAFCAIAMTVALASPANGQDSLWGNSTSSPYDEPKPMPFKKHDHVQIVVLDKSHGSSKADMHTDKRTRLESSLDKWVQFDRSTQGNRRLRNNANIEQLKPEIDLDARFRSDNTGSTKRSFELQFTITAEIVEIRPNGNLVLEAKKERSVNDETESITLTGECAPVAIVGGSVRSDRVANMKVVLKGTGSVNDAQKGGIIGWVLGKLWPF